MTANAVAGVNRIHDATGPCSVDALVAAVGRTVDTANLAGPLALIASGRDAVGAAAWLRSTRREGLVLGPERWTPAIQAACAERGLSAIEVANGRTWPAPAPAPETAGRVWLLTSGTTGAPKWVAHSWDSLTTLKATPALPARHWLLTYQPGTYAWFQVVQLPLAVPRQDLTVGHDPDPAMQLALAGRTGVDAISSTPTFWRVALLGSGEEALARLPLKQITLGGERVDQAILDTLRRLFPSARVSHIYAATEVGAAIVVHDGREGFPAAWLAAPEPSSGAALPDASEGRPQLKVQDGRLWVRSGKAGDGRRDWTDTGDAVETHGDRVLVTGRAAGGLAKVGGATVDLRQVEAAILAEPGVLWCRVTTRKAPVVGSLLVADVVPQPGTHLDGDALRDRLAARLADYMVPRFWRVRHEIPATGNFKTELA